MAKQLKICLDGNAVNIVGQYGPVIKDVLKSKYECNIAVIGMDSVTRQDFGQSRNPPITQEERFSIQLHTIKVSVWKADLTNFRADAVVNAANEKLNHCGGLALALRIAGGPDIQHESDTYIKKNGTVETGQVVVSNPGNLQCKKIIHAVGPHVKSNPSGNEIQQATPLLKKVVTNILAKASEHKCSSVAIPALSSGLFNFPVAKCANIIVETLNDYDKLGDKSGFLREIHLVNIDEPTVQEMDTACRQKWMGTATAIGQAVRSKSNTSGTKTNALHSTLTVQTGNVCLTLMQGLIEDQKTDVIVNTTGDNLCLSNGAVSKAILTKAGRKMQAEMDQMYQKTKRQGRPLVLETKPHGLGCRRVYHTVCPVKGVSGARETLRKAIQECFNLAADHQFKSIAFPAIGTGQLGFPRAEVATVMTAAVKEIARHMPTKMAVYFVIFPSEVDTFRAFEGEIRKLQACVHDYDTGASLGFDKQYTSAAPELRLSSPHDVSNTEARRWLENLFSCADTASVDNNFIQYLSVEKMKELHQLRSNAETATSIEVFFERGCAKIKIQAESPKDVVVCVLRTEAILCAVQKEFAEKVMSHMHKLSAKRSLHDEMRPLDCKDREDQFKRVGLNIENLLPIDNSALIEAFELKKKQLGSSAPLQRMYQRIPAQFCSMLKDIGFQREYAPPDDPRYGEGIYFAGSVRSAVDLWRQQNHGDVYQYYVEARVLTGNSTAGERDLIMPPPVTNDPLIRYDSLTGGNDIAVIFNGHQALPEFICICKSDSLSI